MTDKASPEHPRQPAGSVFNRRTLMALAPAVGVLGSVGAALAADGEAAPAQPSASEAAVEAPGTLDMPTAETLRGDRVPDHVARIVTKGYAAPGDGGGAAWRRIPAAPAHGGYMQDAAGAFFEIDEGSLRPEMFGARGGDLNDLAAIQQAVTVAVRTGRRVDFTRPRYSIDGEIVVPGNVDRFAFVGGGFTDLVQLRDDCSIFFFFGENTRHWRISGFRFLWARNQTARHRNSYAVRFESDGAGGAGHWNFEISSCVLSNGFRGFGQSDDGDKKRKAPVWGANIRNIIAGPSTTGAAIYLRTWGRAGQPNNNVTHFYTRGDNLSEPSIYLEACDTSLLSSVEFNRGRGCQIRLEASSNMTLRTLRFEQVSLGPGDCHIEATGTLTNVEIDGLSLQSMMLPSGVASAPRRPSLLRATNGARITLRNFTDMPWRDPSAVRDAANKDAAAVLDVAARSVAVVERIVPLIDPSLILVHPAGAQGVVFADAASYNFSFVGTGAPTFTPELVRQLGLIVAVTAYTDGLSPAALSGLTLFRNGEPILLGGGDFDLRGPGKRHLVLPRALKAAESRLRLSPGDILTVKLPSSAVVEGSSTVLISLTTVGG